MLKNWPLPRTVVCVYVGSGGGGSGGGGGGWGQDVIQTSTMTPLSATVSRVSTGVGGRGSGLKCIYSQNACWYMRALNNNGK